MMEYAETLNKHIYCGLNSILSLKLNFYIEFYTITLNKFNIVTTKA
jgi:hypothetical protein